MTKDVPFRRIAKVLRELGFEFKTLGAERMFTRPGEDHFILIPVQEGRVRPIFVKGVAHILDQRGLLDRDEFERRMYYGNGAVARR